MERLQEFFDKYAIQKETYTALSKPDCAGRQSLIISDIKDAYNFDKITQLFFPRVYPSSADAILFKGRNIYLIEFKTGFERAKFDRKRCTCEHMNGQICDDYAGLFQRHQKNIDKELKANLFQKAAESRWVLDKHLLPQICSDKENSEDIKVFFEIVIDKVKYDSVETIDEIINDLSNRENEENIYNNMNKSLKKMYIENQITGKPSLYNKAEVLSVEEFEARFLS